MGSRNKRREVSPTDSDEENIEQMKTIVDHFRGEITAINKRLLTPADVFIPKARNEAILSWRKKNYELISVNAVQNEDDCWAHAFARGLYAVLKQHGWNGPFPTAASLVQDMEKKFLTEKKALIKSMTAAPLLLRKYECELVVHRRPKLSLVKENKDFEKFIEGRLALGPVAMCFEYVPSYPFFKHQKHKVFCPSQLDFQALRYEILDGHCGLITGRGVEFSGSVSVEFWEMHETRGCRFGDKGFTRLERHRKLVKEVYEFKPKFDRMEATSSKIW